MNDQCGNDRYEHSQKVLSEEMARVMVRGVVYATTICSLCQEAIMAKMQREIWNPIILTPFVIPKSTKRVTRY